MANKKINTWKMLRILCASVFFIGITLLLLDAAATRPYLGWMAKIQAWPALSNIFGCALYVCVPLLLTLLLGRIYCSVICPLGVMQDLFIWLGSRKWMKRLGKHLGANRFRPTKAHNALRGIVFLLFVLLGAFPITAAFAHLIEPYSLFGKFIAVFTSSYYTWVVYGVLALLFFVIACMAFLRGRLWCNTICPVGTMLSLFSRHPLFAPTIDAEKCNACHKCERNCKAECIDIASHSIDMSRCVDCYECLGQCAQHAIAIRPIARRKKATAAAGSEDTPSTNDPVVDESRRRFLGITGAVLTGTAIASAKAKTDGGLATIEAKQVPTRATRLLPAGARSIRHFERICTGCQLCVSACPNRVLRPSTDLSHWMLPEMEYDKGYCPITCHACSDVCPTGALHLAAPEEKAAIQVGHAVWIRQNCVVLRDEVSCGNCARHCPTGAIQMVPYKGHQDILIPAVDSEKCIGCGHCEYVCPSRPFSAIYVEGHEEQRHV